MQKAIGVVSLVVGVVAVGVGLHISQSVTSQLKEAVTGSPTDRVIYFYIAARCFRVWIVPDFRGPKVRSLCCLRTRQNARSTKPAGLIHVAETRYPRVHSGCGGGFPR